MLTMVNINKQKLTILQQNILRVLFRKSGVSLNQRQLANLLGVTPPAIIKALPLLEKLGFIKLNKDKETKRFSIELNKNNLRVMQLKRVDNLKQVYESDLADFLEKEYAGAIIILFGSYSRGDDLLNSDIDIAIIGRKKKDVNLENYEKFLERKIIINFYESSNKIKLFGISPETANDFVKSCYDIIMELARAKMLLEGYNSSGFGAHEAEVSYMRILDFKRNKVMDRYVDIPVKVENMVILPGSTIILDDNILSLSCYMEEFPDVL